MDEGSTHRSYRGYLYIVSDAPNMMMSRELAVWFAEMDVWGQIEFIDARQRNEACQANAAILHALATSHDHFVFCESDIRPHRRQMHKFWTAKADVVGANYPTENVQAWSDPNVIHAGLWRTSRHVLEAIAAPWFAWEYDEGMTHCTKCLCRVFSEKAIAAGFSVAVAGQADHRPKTDFCGRMPTRSGSTPG